MKHIANAQGHQFEGVSDFSRTVRAAQNIAAQAAVSTPIGAIKLVTGQISSFTAGQLGPLSFGGPIGSVLKAVASGGFSLSSLTTLAESSLGLSGLSNLLSGGLSLSSITAFAGANLDLGSLQGVISQATSLGALVSNGLNVSTLTSLVGANLDLGSLQGVISTVADAQKLSGLLSGGLNLDTLQNIVGAGLNLSTLGSLPDGILDASTISSLVSGGVAISKVNELISSGLNADSLVKLITGEAGVSQLLGAVDTSTLSNLLSNGLDLNNLQSIIGDSSAAVSQLLSVEGVDVGKLLQSGLDASSLEALISSGVHQNTPSTDAEREDAFNELVSTTEGTKLLQDIIANMDQSASDSVQINGSDVLTTGNIPTSTLSLSLVGDVTGTGTVTLNLGKPSSLTIDVTSVLGDAGTANNATYLNGQAASYYTDLTNATGTLASARLSGTYGISISGNAATATILQTSRTIGGVSFDGSANINLPGVNTAGNQNTTGSAATLTTGRTIAMTGDLTWTSPSFNGSGNVTAVGTLATVNSNVGAFGSATQVGTFTIDAKGRTTAASNVTITPAWSSITAKPTTLSGYGITDAANIIHTHAATDITSGTIAAARLTGTYAISISGNATTANNATYLGGQTGTYYSNFTNLTNVPSTFAPSAHTHAISDTTGLQTALDGKQASLGYTAENVANKNATNGYAGLDGSGKLLTSVLPDMAISDTSVIATEAAMLALTAQKGDVAIRTDVSKTYILSSNSPTTLADWKEMLTPASPVLSVAGLVGNISAVALKSALSLAISDTSGLQTVLDAKAALSGATFTGQVIVRADPSYGAVSLVSGTAALPGYADFTSPGGVRRGYVGYGSGTNLLIHSENGWNWNFTQRPLFNGYTPWDSANFNPTNYALVSHTHSFSSLTAKPTTISGYGITDAATSAAFSASPAKSLSAIDSRTITNPLTGIGYSSGGRFRFSALDDVSAPYADVIDLSTYADSSGGGFNSLYFSKSSQLILHKWAAAGGTSWTTKTVAYTDSTLSGSTTGSAATLTTGRTLAMTGDVAWTSPSFNGSANVTAAGTLATVNSNVGSFGSATTSATFTVNAKGLITAAGSTTITPAWSSITSKPTTLAGYGIVDALASSAYTAADVLIKIKTVDGSGSGLDADLLDGNHAAYFTPRATYPASGVDLNTLTDSGFYRMGAAITNGPATAGGYSQLLVVRGSDTMSQIYMNYNDAGMFWRSGASVSDGVFGTPSAWRKMWNDGNDGAGSGLDADLLDGSQRDAAYNSFTGNCIPVRHSAGYLFSNYFNMTADQTATAASRIAVENSSDGYLRWQTPAQFIANHNILLTSGNAATATTLQTARTIGGVSFNGSANINLPGVNTAGTQSTTGNAATATALATGRTIAMTGDLTWTSPSFTGAGNVTAAGTLATVNGNVGAFGSATQVATFTVNAKGLTTAASNVTITPAWSSITSKPTTISGFGITDLLASIQAIDGAGSGLDADLLDGLNSDRFLTVAAASPGLWAPGVPGVSGASILGGWHGTYGGTHQYMAFGSSTGELHWVIDGDYYANNGTAKVWHAGNFNPATKLDASLLVEAATASTAVKRNSSGGIIVQDVYHQGIRDGAVGVYSAADTQAIWAMGDAYKLDKTGPDTYGNLYGLAWSYNPNYAYAGNNPQSKPGLNHQMLIQMYGVTQTAIGSGIWTVGNITGGAIQGATVTATSDIKLKKNVTDLTGALDLVLAMKPRRFDWKLDGRSDIGVIAQELELVVPEVVYDGADDTKTVNYGALGVVAIAAIQELQDMVIVLTERIRVLEGK